MNKDEAIEKIDAVIEDWYSLVATFDQNEPDKRYRKLREALAALKAAQTDGAWVNVRLLKDTISGYHYADECANTGCDICIITKKIMAAIDKLPRISVTPTEREKEASDGK